MKKALVLAVILIGCGAFFANRNLESATPSDRIASGVDVSDYRVSYFYGRDEADWITDVPASSSLARQAARDALAPLALAYSSWLGGRADDWGCRVAVNATGIYVAGMTKSMNFPPAAATKPRWDAFVTKLSADGRSLIYTAFFPVGNLWGGKGLGLAVDDKGRAVLAGNTRSRQFPVKNAFQPEIGGGIDGFVLMIYPSGKGLVYSSFLGGSMEDCCFAAALDAQGIAHVGGYTTSSDFPVVDPFQSRLRGKMDAFVSRVSADGRTLLASTYLGGKGPEMCRDLALDASGCDYVTGFSSSRDFPVKKAVQAAYGGTQDVFVTKFPAADLSRLTYSTYLGGGSKDDGTGVDVDDAGAAYVVGYAQGTFPTVNAFQKTRKGGADAFAAKIDPSGTSLLYSTYLGGVAMDLANDVRVDATGAALVFGTTRSRAFPVRNAYQAVMNGSSDAFMTVFSADGKKLLESTFFGGSYSEQGTALFLDADGSIYLTGLTESPDFPSAWPYQKKLAGGTDAFVLKFTRNGD